jgi:hypothetical protein
MPDDFDDDAKTPEQGRMRPLTDSELEFFKVKYTSGVPVIGEFDDREDTSPIDLFDRAPRPAARDIVARLRQNPEKVIPFLGELAEWVALKMRERSSSEQSALTELRELLSKPPNGATKRLQEDVRGLGEAIGELAERLDALERKHDDVDDRVKPVEATFASGRRFLKAAVIGLITTVLGSAVGIIATLQARAKEEGAADERSRNQQMRIERLERLSDERSNRGRRDYGYDHDIAPRPEPLKKE